MSINDLNLTVKNEIVEITLPNGTTVEVKQYLQSEQKNNILEIALQQAMTSTILNLYALEVLFELYTVLKYSNIEVSYEELEDPFAVYDLLESNGIISLILAAIPEEEYKTLYNSMIAMTDKYHEYSISITSAINNLTTSISNLLNMVNIEDVKKGLEELKTSIQQ